MGAVVTSRWNKRTLFLVISLVVLLGSVVIWSLAGALLQQQNADQLIDGYLFSSWRTFHTAQFPLAHSLLIKWPFFIVISALHDAPWAFVVMTILLATSTVVGLAYLMWRIEKRPVMLGLEYLGLASILALVPVWLAASPTTPLNMAMVSGRNIEYVLYLGALICLIMAKRVRSLAFIVATALLTLLCASDHLFVAFGIGGAAALLATSYAMSQYQLQRQARNWAISAVAAWLLSTALLMGIRGHMTGLVDGFSPYGHATAYNVVNGTGDIVRSILVNFGITTTNGGLSFIPACVNMVLLALVCIASYRLITTAVHRKQLSKTDTLAVMLMATSLATFIIFVATNQSYLADARYLTILLFTGCVSVVAYARTQKIPQHSKGIAGALSVALCIGLSASVIHAHTIQTTNQLTPRNKTILSLLRSHPEQILVGSYWRVVPIKEQTPHAEQQILPLDNCAEPATTLSSNAWEVDLRTHSFAYILSLQPTGIAGGACPLGSVISAYGLPTSTRVVVGTTKHPIELLLFYDQGAEIINDAIGQSRLNQYQAIRQMEELSQPDRQ